MFRSVLISHILSGSLGLALGPVAMVSRKGKGLHTRTGEVYHWLMLAVCVSAVLMALFHWEKSWYFLFIGAFSYWNAFKGYMAAKKRERGWISTHISGMLGSYIALVTALLVVNGSNLPALNRLPSLTVWLLPTLIGIPLIAFVQRRFNNRRPGIGVRQVNLA